MIPLMGASGFRLVFEENIINLCQEEMKILSKFVIITEPIIFHWTIGAIRLIQPSLAYLTWISPLSIYYYYRKPFRKLQTLSIDLKFNL